MNLIGVRYNKSRARVRNLNSRNSSLLRGRPVDADDDCVISLIRLQGDLLLWLHLLRLHLLDFSGEYCLGLGGRVNAISLQEEG